MMALPCPACGESTTRPLYWKPVDEETARLGIKPSGLSGYQIVACMACGLGRVDPCPGAEELATLYGDEYFNTQAYRGLPSDSLIAYRRVGGPPRLAAIRAASMRGYERTHVADLAAWYASLHPTCPTPRRFLDVGAGSGGVLAAAQEIGWTAVGVEPSPTAARSAASKGLVIVPTELAEAGFPDGCFDIVHIREVLEHVLDPLALVSEAHRVLRPGGLLYVQVPNDLEGYRRAIFSRVWWLIPPYHLWYFTFASLERLLARVGLMVHVRGTLGLGVGVDTYRYLGAQLGVLAWLDAHEDDERLALAPRLTRAAFRAAGAPADVALNRARRHTSLWVCATA